jgi:hypothetical protein
MAKLALSEWIFKNIKKILFSSKPTDLARFSQIRLKQTILFPKWMALINICMLTNGGRVFVVCVLH